MSFGKEGGHSLRIFKWMLTWQQFVNHIQVFADKCGSHQRLGLGITGMCPWERPGGPPSTSLQMTQGQFVSVFHLPLLSWNSPPASAYGLVWYIIEMDGKIDPLFFFFFLAAPQGLQNLSSLTRDWTWALCTGSLQSFFFFFFKMYLLLVLLDLQYCTWTF